jgi:hypothetical protein
LKKQTEDELKLRIDSDVAAGLRDYCEFLQSPQNYVVTEVLRKALRKDKAFANWRAERPAGSDAAQMLNKRTRPRSAGNTSAIA